MTLKDLNIGETAVVGTVGGEGALRQHFLDMGLIPGEEVTLVKFAPMGDPMELSKPWRVSEDFLHVMIFPKKGKTFSVFRGNARICI